MTGYRRSAIFLVILLLLLAILACSLTQQGPEGGDEPPEEPTPTATEAPTFPEEDVTVSEPGGAEVAIAAGALSGEAEVAVEDIGEGVPFTGGSPMSPASAEYLVEFGDAQQIGEIRMTVPLDGAAKQAAVESSFVYLVWTEPEGSTPSVVGARVVEDKIQFPIVGAGKYQVFRFSITAH